MSKSRIKLEAEAKKSGIKFNENTSSVDLTVAVLKKRKKGELTSKQQLQIKAFDKGVKFQLNDTEKMLKKAIEGLDAPEMSNDEVGEKHIIKDEPALNYEQNQDVKKQQELIRSELENMGMIDVNSDNIDDLINALPDIPVQIESGIPKAEIVTPLSSNPGAKQAARIISESELSNYGQLILTSITSSFRYTRGLMTIEEVKQTINQADYPFTYKIEINGAAKNEVALILISGNKEKRFPVVGWLTLAHS